MHDREETSVITDELVRRVQPRARIADDARGLTTRERNARLNVFAFGARTEDAVDGHAVDPLHHEHQDAVVLGELVGRADVRMTDARSDARLVEEHLPE